MWVASRIMVMLGIFIVAYAALVFDTTIASTASGERIHNMGLMNIQLVLAMFGCSAFLAGVVVASVHDIRQAILASREERADE